MVASLKSTYTYMGGVFFFFCYSLSVYFMWRFIFRVKGKRADFNYRTYYPSAVRNYRNRVG